MKYETRKATRKLIEMMDEGVLAPRAVADMALAYMSEDDVAEMARANDFDFDGDDDIDVGEEDINDDMDGDHESALTSAGWGVDESYSHDE